MPIFELIIFAIANSDAKTRITNQYFLNIEWVHLFAPHICFIYILDSNIRIVIKTTEPSYRNYGIPLSMEI